MRDECDLGAGVAHLDAVGRALDAEVEGEVLGSEAEGEDAGRGGGESLGLEDALDGLDDRYEPNLSDRQAGADLGLGEEHVGLA